MTVVPILRIYAKKRNMGAQTEQSRSSSENYVVLACEMILCNAHAPCFRHDSDRVEGAGHGTTPMKAAPLTWSSSIYLVRRVLSGEESSLMRFRRELLFVVVLKVVFVDDRSSHLYYYPEVLC